MNMFKRNKKEKDFVLGAVSSGETSFSKASRSLTRKKKKQIEEEEPGPSLTSALPEVNEFRTSLLMPNLSARFSMLREQDDPNTKVGKASDDSVLFPKRISRLNLFQSNPLMDIAEVASIRSEIRPPFAGERSHSVSDDYASDDGSGSIMNRSRPGEGNNLFGGRQKMYMIAAGSARDLPNNMMGGKHMYESDVALSAFQRYRKGRESPRDPDDSLDLDGQRSPDNEEAETAGSPSTAFSKNRGTQSSTNSAPSNRRTSTAATSLTSDSPIRRHQGNTAVTKVREQDANSSAESFGATTSLRKVREDGARPPFRLSASRSAVNMHDVYNKSSSSGPMPSTFRVATPPVNAFLPSLDFGLDDNSKKMSPMKNRERAVSPPLMFDFGITDTLAHNVQPNDRGKATAMGLFNKPQQAYDDKQFSQRQVQMYEGRTTPSELNSRAASRASPEPQQSGRSSNISARVIPSPLPQDENYPRVPPIPEPPMSPIPTEYSSAGSVRRQSASRARSKSSASTKEANVKARVESLIRKQNAELAAMEAQHVIQSRSYVDIEPPLPSAASRKSVASTHTNDNPHENAPYDRAAVRSMSGQSRPSLSNVHPALRDGISEFNFGTEAEEPAVFPRISSYSVASKARPSTDQYRRSEHESVRNSDTPEMPTVSTEQGLGLSGLIQTHLRHNSDKSSIYPPPSPAFPPPHTNDSRLSTVSMAKTLNSVKNDPFEYDSDKLKVNQPAILEQPPTPTTAMSQRAQELLGLATALRDANNAELAKQSPIAENRSQHQRTESTDTQREQQRFDEELAERRKRIEQQLKSVQERSRSRSPSTDTPHSFSLPRFPGRSNTGGSEGGVPSKTMKILGLARDQSSPRPSAETWNSDFDRPRKMSSRQGSRPPTSQEYERNGRQTPGQGRSYSRTGTSDYDRSQSRSATPSSRAGYRDRSNSAADRSQSRNKNYGGDLDAPAMPGGFPISPNPRVSPNYEFGQRSESPAVGRDYERSASSAAGQYKERGYFTAKPLAPSDHHTTARSSPRPSPNPESDTSLPPMSTPMSPKPSMPMSPNSAAFVNGRTTPTANGRSTPSGQRKRSVTKTMISEPTFVSSTSSVSLVHLPKDGGPPVEPIFAPPIPSMNPRRRGTGGESSFSPRLGTTPLPTIDSPTATEFGADARAAPAPPQPRPRNKLRKSSSEGGNMAAKARAQAVLAEIEKEKKARTAANSMFPNRSATSLGVAQEGGMF